MKQKQVLLQIFAGFSAPTIYTDQIDSANKASTMDNQSSYITISHGHTPSAFIHSPVLVSNSLLVRLGTNMKGFPSSTLPAVSAVLFHSSIAAILLLYALFWLKLNLFMTLKALGFLGVFLIFVGHRTLSHLAASSSKLKSS